MTITGIITAILIGAVVGVLGRLVLPGKQPIGMLVTVLVGIVSAFIGTAHRTRARHPDCHQRHRLAGASGSGRRCGARRCAGGQPDGPPSHRRAGPPPVGAHALTQFSWAAMAFRPALDLLHHPCVAVGIGEFDHRAPITIVEDVDITGGNAFFGERARPTSGPIRRPRAACRDARSPRSCRPPCPMTAVRRWRRCSGRWSGHAAGCARRRGSRTTGTRC